MNRDLKSKLWLVCGPIGSLILAWYAIWLLGFVLVGGFDINDRNPPWQQLVGKLANPVAVVLFFGGTFFSLFMAWASLRNPED